MSEKPWDGKERRRMMFDKDFYDKMMETHHDVKKMVKWSSDHDQRDDARFKDINKKLLWGGVILVGVASASGMTLPQLFKVIGTAWGGH